MRTLSFIVGLLIFCELGQWVVNHYMLKTLKNHNDSFRSVYDILKISRR